VANVTIYAEHRDILDALITSGKVASVAGGTNTGPFKDQRDAYLYAVSIAMALNKPTAVEKMPTSKKNNTSIRDSVFLGAAGARELAISVALLIEKEDASIEQSLSHQLDLISEEHLDERFSLLDRFAHAGFSWLDKRRSDESSIRDLVLTSVDEIDCVNSEASATEVVSDPMWDMLDMQL
jgi:hypothetical protein